MNGLLAGIPEAHGGTDRIAYPGKFFNPAERDNPRAASPCRHAASIAKARASNLLIANLI